MSTAKKVLKNIISGGFEAVKDSAKQLGQTVGPGALLESALGQKKPDEFSEYLKNLGDKNLTPAELEKKKKEMAEKEEEDKKKLRTYLQATPVHMRLPQNQKEPTAYEKIQQEEAQRVKEANVREKMPKVLQPTGSRPKPGGLFARRKGGRGFEGLQKDTKVG